MEKIFMIPQFVGSVRLVDMQYTKGNRGYTYPSHRHTIFEYMYMISGELEVIINEHPYSLSKGDSLIIKPGMFHQTPPTKEDAAWFLFHFEVEDKRIHEILQRVQHPVIRKEQDKSLDKYVSRLMDRYGGFLSQMGSPYAQRPTSSESLKAAVVSLKVQSSILHLISLLSNRIYRLTANSAPPLAASTIQPSVIRLAHEAAYWLEKKATENMKIGELADQLNIDRSYLTNSFKKVYGQSPRSYRTQVIIRKAKGMLVDTPWSIEKISQELHFSSPAHFVKFFLNQVGTTPLKYRNKAGHAERQ